MRFCPSRQVPVLDHHPRKFRTTITILKYRHQDRRQNRLDEMVPIIGFELMTYRLQGGCSTN
jgi:hypothetical protein